LQYVLDKGQEIEVIRNFDRRREAIQVYDRTHAREITAEFELLRNREVDFASSHLGLTKDVFCGVATIGHFSLDDLGDHDALNQIREKLLTLADSAEESNSAEATLKLLKNRVTEIGASNARTKPLAMAHARLSALQQELGTAQALQRELEEVSEKRVALAQEIAQVRELRLRREEDSRVLEAHMLAGRLREAEALSARINQATQQCFALGAVRDFPHQREAELNRMETQINTARVQLERTRKEHVQLLQQLKEERRRLGSEAAEIVHEVPEEAETRLTTLSTSVEHLRERLGETENLVELSRNRLKEAQVAVTALPDFSRIASDPVEWITQLASSFSIALRSRDDEVKLRTRLRGEVDQRRAATRTGEELFRECQDFAEQSREYELEKRVQQDHIVQGQSRLQTLQLAEEEIAGDVPEMYWLLALCVAFLGVLGGVFVRTQNVGFLYAGALGGLASLYFMYKISNARLRLKRTQQEIEGTRADVERLEKNAAGEPGLIDRMMQQGGCQTVRELEATYDQYRLAMAELNAREEALAAQEEKAEEAEERVQKMLERIRGTFKDVGENLADEYGVQEATGRVVARYQEYREVKRRVSDSRSVLERHEAEHKRLLALLHNAEEELGKAEAQVRQFMHDHGFTEDSQFPTVTAALRAYRERVSGRREQRARVDLLQEKSQALERRIKAEEFDLEKHEQQLAHLLAKAGVSTLIQWHETAAKAREYQEIWARRGSLEEQLAMVLQGQDLKQLRENVKHLGALPPPPSQNREQLKSEIEQLGGRVDALMKEEHALHILITQRTGGVRSLNEIEEDLAAVGRQMQDLDLEYEATTYAMALIEEMARDKHARIAPRLADKASQYFKTITGGAYNELLISRDMTISVRIPQTNRMEEAPEKSLSKGTVDQLYLSLRLALVRAMSDSTESIPMLLDDPFANYDDVRLERTLRLLAEIGTEHQILLFTCREDVARAAESLNTPIVRLNGVAAATPHN
ncbi:MAG: hypothetical protein HYZ00_08420, partial [Candidatus Hydrogenedentes bacterium]|nr:hypothetical protein [Candidatus Hydrogenedentota bacterium]